MPNRPYALVADDDVELRFVISTHLNRKFEVLAVNDGTAALSAILSTPAFAVAVLDCDMPGLNGPEVVARARDAGCEVPVLLMSGSTAPKISGLLVPGRTAFLEKPFNRDQLFEALTKLTGH